MAAVTENLQSVISVSPVIFLRFLVLVAFVILASPVVKIISESYSMKRYLDLSDIKLSVYS